MAAGSITKITTSEKNPLLLDFINPRLLKRHLRSLIDRYRHKRNKSITHSGDKVENKLLFVFQGRNGSYKNIGQAFYEEEIIFRELIKRCHKHCIQKFGFDLLHIFEDKDFDLETASEQHVLVTITAIQCALADFYASKGLIPGASSGVSLGEVAAAYAAGAFSIEDAISIAFYTFDTISLMNEKGILLATNLSEKEAIQLIIKSSGKLFYIAEFSSNQSMLFYANKDADSISDVLTKNVVIAKRFEFSWAYHTPFAINFSKKQKEGLLNKFATIVYKPLNIDFYSSLYGGAITAGTTLQVTFFFDMLTQPVLFRSSIAHAINNGFNLYVNIGAHPNLSKHIQACAAELQKTVQVFDSFRKDQPETLLVSDTVRQLKKMLPVYDYYSGFMSDDYFKDPFRHYALLRKIHPVHYISKQNYWLILNYADVDFALKNREIFSSSPAKGLDAVLLGAAPLDHARSRKLLAPFFKNALIGALSLFIGNTAEALLQNIQHGQFDIVTDYAIPLTETVICHFMGLNNQQCRELQYAIGTNRYELSYIPALESFFSAYLKQNEGNIDGSFCNSLLNNDKEKGFTNEELASILKLLWVAGTTTTSMLISSSVLILSTRPGMQEEMRSDPSKLPLFIEEVLRYESPEQTSWRTTTADINISGIVIPRNSDVRLCLGSANRDPSVFEFPDEFIANRHSKKHLAFAAGAHYCLGAELARLEARIAIDTLLKKCRRLMLNNGPDRLEYLHSDHFRALKHLAVRIE